MRTERTKELIEKFLTEAGEWDASVEYTFTSLWRILLSRFKAETPNFIRAVNIQYYFLGYLNYGCLFKESGGVHLRKFDYTKSSKEWSPEFKCTLAAEGCRSDNDCHYRVGVKCRCYGSSCVLVECCDWKTWGSRCGCYNGNKAKRTEVWNLRSRDVVQQGSGHGAHHKSGNQDQSREAEDEDHWDDLM